MNDDDLLLCTKIANLRLSEQETKRRASIVALVQDICRRVYPNASVIAIGSFRTDTGLQGCDLDLSLRVHESGETEAILKRLHGVFHSLASTSAVNISSTIRVPILRLRMGGVDIDLSVNNLQAIQSSEWLAKELGNLKYTLIYLKYWFKKYDFCNVYRGGLSSYGLALMLIGMRKVQPQDAAKEVGFFDTISSFASFWSHWNYQYAVLDPRRGLILNKDDLQWNIPHQPFLLSILDPVDGENDVTRQAYCIRDILANLSTTLIDDTARFLQPPPAALHDGLVNYESE